MAQWHETYQLPSAGNMMHGNDERARQGFIDVGTSISDVLESEISSHFGAVREDLQVLDFGCGNGRVALPLFHKHGKPTAAVDPNPNVIAYLTKTIPEARPQVSNALPPLPFEENTFDVVYSISVWTHLPLQMQWPWLREINRVLKMGGIALISTSSYVGLAMRRNNRNIPGWKDVTDDDLRLEGIMYKRGDKSLPGNPRAGSEWGYVLHNPDWVQQEWGRLFDYRGCRISKIAGAQDLHVLVKNKEVKPSDLTELLVPID